jgi:hypothetical protein
MSESYFGAATKPTTPTPGIKIRVKNQYLKPFMEVQHGGPGFMKCGHWTEHVLHVPVNKPINIKNSGISVPYSELKDNTTKMLVITGKTPKIPKGYYFAKINLGPTKSKFGALTTNQKYMIGGFIVLLLAGIVGFVIYKKKHSFGRRR